LEARVEEGPVNGFRNLRNLLYALQGIPDRWSDSRLSFHTVSISRTCAKSPDAELVPYLQNLT